MTRKKICVVIPGMSDGGAQKQCIHFLNELQKSDDVDVTLIYFHAGVHDALLDRGRLNVIHMPVSSNYDPRNILKLRALIRKIKPAILMTWLHNCDVMGFFVRRAVPGLRWVMTERDSSYPRDPRYILRRILGRYADAIIANSEKGRDYWARVRPHGTLHVVSNIVHVASSGGGIAPSGRVATIGRLEPQKNPMTVIRAFCRLASGRPDLDFVVIGQGSQREALEDEARSSGADISFLGFRSDVDRQIAEAGVLVSMSHHEGLPNVMLESVAGDRLVVASDIPEHRALLGDDYPFLVSAREDPERVAEAVSAALDVRADTTPLAHARARLASMTPKAVVAAYREIFDSVGGVRQ